LGESNAATRIDIVTAVSSQSCSTLAFADVCYQWHGSTTAHATDVPGAN
jgi:hypothetical protein